MGRDSLCNLAIKNGNPICVRNIEGHITSQHTVCNDSAIMTLKTQSIFGPHVGNLMDSGIGNLMDSGMLFKADQMAELLTGPGSQQN